MNKIFFVLMILFLNCNVVNSQTIVGKIRHDDIKFNKIIDYDTNNPLANAKITIPDLHFTTFSDENGAFKLNADVTDRMVLFVEKDGYKTFSLTIDNNVIKNPLKLGIHKANPFDMQISQGVVHLGDNMFSSNSANSDDFQLGAKGPYLLHKFEKPNFGKNQDVVVHIGTIIGIDTQRAKTTGQNRIAKVYSSPMEIFVNDKRIAFVDINGDNFNILIPKSILKEDNELVIKTGKNLFQVDYVDYDDVELANIRIEVKERKYYAGFR